MTWRGLLRARLLDLQPASVCALDAAAFLAARDSLPNTPIHAHDPPRDSPCALALGIDVLNGLNRQQMEYRICQIRLYVAPRVLLVMPSACALDADAFRALGFMLLATDPVEGKRIHYYDLDTYKTVPDWLNARFWANPERWKP